MISSVVQDFSPHDDEEQSNSPKQSAYEGPKSPSPRPWLHPMIFSTLIFVVSNKVECLDKQLWVVQLVLIDYLGMKIVFI
jgi:hypothetical protein